MLEATLGKGPSGVVSHCASASRDDSMKPIDSSSGVVWALPTTNDPASSTTNVSVIVPPASIARTRGLRSAFSPTSARESIRGLRTFEPMLRRLLILVLVLLALLGISQLVIPPIAEHRISDRLTAGGGSADVSLSALPAARLLFGDGSRITVTGEMLDLTAESESSTVFSNLDGYDRVAVNLDRFRAGPFALGSFELTRAGPEAPYHLVTQGRTTPTDLASYGASSFGLPGGP